MKTLITCIASIVFTSSLMAGGEQKMQKTNLLQGNKGVLWPGLSVVAQGRFLQVHGALRQSLIM